MSTPTASSDVNNENEKKKKRIRKKKPKQDGTHNKSGKAPAPSNVPLNPQSVLRNRLAQEGFSTNQVDQAMEEMWDKGLAYDEFDAVLMYLKGETPRNNEKEENTADKKQSIESNVVNGVNGVNGGGTKVAGKPTQETPKTTAEKAKVIKPAPPMTMEQKLETVANFENLTDAIFALTEWINKAAKPRDLEDLCAATKTKALVTIFQRSITETRDQSQFDKLVLPSMVRLMESLLQKSGIPAAGVSETQSAFEPLLRKARTTYTLQEPDAMDFLQRVSQFIVSRISLAIGESNTFTSVASSINGTLPRFSTPGPDVLGGDSTIAAVLSEREIHMTAAKRYGAVTASVCAELASAGGRMNTLSAGLSSTNTEIALSDIMVALLGKDAKASYERQKASLEELKSLASRTESDATQDLRRTMKELTEERESVAQRILELKKSIEKLEIYDAELCVKANDMQLELQQQTAHAAVEASRLTDNVNKASEALKYGSSIIDVANSLKKYDDSLNRAIASSTKKATVPNGDTATFAGKQMEIFLSYALKYFESEAKATCFLKNRIATSSKTLQGLKTDMVELEALGLRATISQMKEAAKKQEESIENDSAMLQRFEADVTYCFDSLLARLQEYQSAQSFKSLKALPANVLAQILTVASNLELASTQRLKGFIDATENAVNSSFSTPAVPGMVEPTKVVSEMAAPPELVEVEKPAPPPKLSWAAAKPAWNNPSGKTSLRDIQKEEMQSKGTA